MSKKIICAFIFYFGLSNSFYAQSLANEIGFIAGPSLFKSDYGERSDVTTNLGQLGFGIGAVHYMNFAFNSNYYTYFKEHFKVRSELSFNQTKLNHFGYWVENSSSLLAREQLKNMEGKTSTINLGSQLEFYLTEISVHERNQGALNPYISFGVQYNYYSAKAYSNMGTLGSPEATFPKYLVPSDGHPYGFSTESKSTWSLVYGAGVRYNLGPLSDLVFDCRLQYFGSDWVDGVNPNKDIYKENKYNDWQVWTSFGYIFYIEAY